MECIYKDFAYIYDRLMCDVDYKKWSSYIEQIFKKNNIMPKLVVDLGCGTGSFCVEMASRNFEMIGIDISEEMLSCAKEKALSKGLELLLLNQDMTDFELYGTADAIVCLMDSVNYITDPQDLRRMFKLVHNYLNPGGLFVFDVNSAYKFKYIFADNVYYTIEDDITLIWQNMFDDKTNLCEFDLTFFVKEGSSYKRYDEVHLEKCYHMDEMKQIIKSSGLELEEIYNEFSFDKPEKKSERLFYVCRKPI